MRSRPPAARVRVLIAVLTGVAMAAAAPPVIGSAAGTNVASGPAQRGHKPPTSTPAPTPTPTPTPTPSPTPTPTPFPNGTSDEAVAYQNDYGHDGAQPGDALTPPLVRRWSVDLGEQTTYPLIAGGRVFVAAASSDSASGGRLYVFDAPTGGLDWSQNVGVPGSAGISFGIGLAYDGGRVFATDATDNELWAFDAASGAVLWHSAPAPNPGDFPTAPTAVAGAVYYQAGNTVLAVRESDGATLWRGAVDSLATGAPAVDASRVYEGYTCAGAYSFASSTGSLAWRVEPCFGGGGGGTPALSGGRVYVRGQTSVDTPAIYDAATGAVDGQFCATYAPAFDGATGFFPAVARNSTNLGATLSSVTLASQAVNWTFAGDGALTSNVLVANGFVYVGSASGTVYALNESTGQQAWTDDTGSPIQSGAAMAIGEGLLAVPATNVLTVYATSASTCAPGPATTIQGGPQSTFYFAEGSTEPGFSEQLVLTSPRVSGTARIDYFTSSGMTSATASLTAGQPLTVDVGGAVGANPEVGVRVQLPGPGTAERLVQFQTAQRHGSSEQVGTTALSGSWFFPVGSTLGTSDEYLSLLNPASSAVTVNLDYLTDAGGFAPIKTLVLGPQSRTTVEVFSGDTTSSAPSCVPNGAGANCGVGRGVGKVSVAVQAQNGGQLVAERTIYLNGFDFGSGPIVDGDTTFGATSEVTAWYFADGTTQPGFDEHLTLTNFSAFSGTADLHYYTDTGQEIDRQVTLAPEGVLDVDVADPTNGAGPGLAGVSAIVSAPNGIVVERSLYVVHDFGSGTVAGADFLAGAVNTLNVFGFGSASTQPGESDFLTIFNADFFIATVTLTYFTASRPVRRTVSVPPRTRLVVSLSDPVLGPGSGLGPIGVTATSTARVVIEKSAYGSSAANYGAGVTAASTPSLGFF